MEAVMVRTHPRWLGARELVRGGRIGELRSMVGFFSYFNESPDNVRHQPGMGGGGLLDIGFYPVTMSRFIFEAEPLRVMGLLEIDPRFGVDRLASAILEFPRGHAIFTCSTQLQPYQTVDILGHARPHRHRDPVEHAARAAEPPAGRRRRAPGRGRPRGGVVSGVRSMGRRVRPLLRGHRSGGPAPVPIEDAVANMRVLDAIARSARTGRWEVP